MRRNKYTSNTPSPPDNLNSTEKVATAVKDKSMSTNWQEINFNKNVLMEYPSILAVLHTCCTHTHSHTHTHNTSNTHSCTQEWQLS